MNSNETFSSAMLDATNYNNWIIDSFGKHIKGDLLEIGIGHGGFYDLVKDKISSYAGLDIDNNLIEHAKSLNPNQEYFLGDVSSENFSDKINNKKFDNILCANVLEHIENDSEALSNIFSSLKKDGKLLLFVLAFNLLYNDMDKLAGHHRRYIKSDIQKVVDKFDVDICLLRYFNSIGGVGWFCNKLITHKSLDSKTVNKQTIFFDKYLAPLAKKVDILTSSFFGQSLICVLVKK